uniref:Transposase n=1 Tax=Ophiostoma novo-ulmi subsp. novo-ulmi TaxID=170179 RepID=Q152S1_OPHNO|nr:transposase [Ophiostoma novo-ulmi subsp. novo-ulmi]
MREYTEENVIAAVQAVQNGTSYRKASKQYGVPVSTILTRVQGAKPRHLAFQHLQKLSEAQETRLASWICTQGALGRPPTHAQVKAIAASLLGASPDENILGKNWLHSFLRRNPSIKVQKSKSIDAKRVNGASTDAIRTWFRRLDIPEIKHILPQNRWNMDETGFSSSQGDPIYVLGTAEKTKIRKKQVGSRAWTSTIECVSAAGASLPPLIIFKGKKVQQQWFPTDLSLFNSWQFTATNNGWTDYETGLKWLEDVFIPCSAPARPSEARLLVIDGHGSHETDGFMKLCFENNIFLLFLPSHSSHVLQPLDLTIFSPLKAYYKKEIEKIGSDEEAVICNKRTFLKTYAAARTAALTAKNIKMGWRTAGLWPRNVMRPLMSPFVLSVDNQPSTPNETNTIGFSSSRAIYDSTFYTPTIIWETPKKSTDWSQQVHKFSQQEGTSTSSRYFFQKLRKGFDEKLDLLASQKRKIEDLEAIVDTLRPRKKKAVVTTPNSKFATIWHVQRTQITARETVTALDNSSDEEV